MLRESRSEVIFYIERIDKQALQNFILIVLEFVKHATLHNT